MVIDAALITHCAGPDLKPALIEAFIAKAGTSDPLAIHVRDENRVILLPAAKTP